MIRLAKFATLVVAIVVAGCDREPEQERPGTTIVELTDDQQAALTEATKAAWRLAEPALESTEDNAQQLLATVGNLLQEPSENTLAQAQSQWQQTALAYQPLRIYANLATFKPVEFAVLRELNFAIAAQPIQPGYLDSFGEYAYSGMVHDISLPITKASLREQHGMTNDEDASLGLYAMQFMLFGEGSEQPRQVSDFAARDQLTADDRGQGFNDPAELPENRRRQLLVTQAQALLEDIQRLRTVWQPQAENSLHQSFADRSTLQRRNLLLRCARQEIMEALAKLVSSTDGATTEEAEQQNQQGEKLPLDAITLSHTAARLEFMNELLPVLQVTEELQQHLQDSARLFKEAAQSGNITATGSEQIVQSLQVSSDLLADATGSVPNVQQEGPEQIEQ